mgnify:CR=1 FL=1
MKKSIIRILAIDPGLTNTGWVILECDPIKQTCVITKLGEFHPGPAADKADHRDETERFSKRTISLKVLRENLNLVLSDNQPDYIAAEDIFFNPTRPMAHAALAMWHCVTRLACLDMLGKPLEVIPTKIAKQETTGSGGNGKLSVQQAIMTNKDIVFKSKALEMQVTEHCADAIAVGYAFLKRNRERILMENDLIKHA